MSQDGEREDAGERPVAGAPALVPSAPPRLPPDAATQAIVACVDDTHRMAMQVRDWFEDRERRGTFAHSFEVVRPSGTGDRSLGFFDTATVGGRTLNLMGCVQEMLFDRERLATGREVRDQLREFVLRYFMRVCHAHAPRSAAPAEPSDASGVLRFLSWHPEPGEKRVGFGYEQLAYRERASGSILQVPHESRGAVADLRDIGPVYDWLAMRVNIFDFNLALAPLGRNRLHVDLPLNEVTYVLMTPDGVIDREHPSPGVLGEYGFSYGLMPYTHEDSILAYGPGQFLAGYQSIVFQLLSDGAIKAKAVFVVDRPTKVLKVDIDPIEWSFRMVDMVTFNAASRAMAPVRDLARRLPLRLAQVDPVSMSIDAVNALSGGMAASHFGISMTRLERLMLAQHHGQHHDMLLGAALVWRRVTDWTRPESLPDVCRRGFVA